MLLLQQLTEICHLLKLLAQGNPYTKTLPKTFRPIAVTLTATDAALTGFDSDALTNEKYPFELHMVDVIDTSATSNWRLKLSDRATDWAILGAPGHISTNAIRGLNQSGGTEKTGEPTGLGQFLGYRIGATGGFMAEARSVGTATVAELTLKGIWIVEP